MPLAAAFQKALSIFHSPVVHFADTWSRHTRNGSLIEQICVWFVVVCLILYMYVR